MSGSWNPVSWVEPVFKSITDPISKLVQSIGTVVNPIVNNALKDPVATIAQIGAYALAPETGGASLYALPAISATSVISHGGDVTKALESAGIQLATMGVANNYAGDLAQYLGVSPTTAKILISSAGSTAGNLATTGDINKALTAGGTSLLSGMVGSQVGGALKDDLGATASSLAGKIAGATAGAAANSKDPSAAIANSLLGTALSQTGSVLNSAWNTVNSTISDYNKQLEQASSLYKDQLLPSQQSAVEAQNTAKTAYDNYDNLNKQYQSLVSQYNDAKSANNVSLANSLADQANALVPKLNEATNQYNSNATTFQTALDKFNTLNSQYTDSTNQLSSLKDQYTTQNDQLNKTTEEFGVAAQKVAGMSSDAQTAFTNLTGNGTDIGTAFDTTAKLNGLSAPAQQAFNITFGKSNDPTVAMNFATDVNSLSAPQQTVYSNAVSNGLSVDQALNAVPIASNMASSAQNTYFNALKSGDSPDVAANKALVAQVLTSGEDTSTTPKSVTPTGTVTISGISNEDLAKYGVSGAPADTTAAAPETETPAPATTSSGLSDSTIQAFINGLFRAPNSTNVRGGAGPSVAPVGPSTAATSPLGSILPTASFGAAPLTLADTTSYASDTTAARKPQFADLTAQFTQGTPVELANQPTFTFQTPTTPAPAQNVDNSQQIMQQILNAADGGIIRKFSNGGGLGWTQPMLQASFTKGEAVSHPLRFHGAQLPGYHERRFAAGGDVAPEGHNPTFFSEGGLNSLENTYVQGEGDGTSDSVAAMLANGEFVIPADVVSKLGNGSNEAGASVLDQFLVNIRQHAQSNSPDKLPPKSKGPLAYLLDAKRKV